MMIQLVIADDESRICSAIKYVISNSFPQVNIAGIFYDGEELYNYLTNHHVDILIADIEMPNKNGLDIIDYLRLQGKHCYTIVITAYREFDYAVRALNSRVDAFVTKPFSSEKLEEIVRVGISTCLSKNIVFSKQWDATANLIKSAYSNLNSEILNGILLCQGAAPLESLTCTEIIVSSENTILMTLEEEKVMMQDIKVAVEMDSEKQSVFLLHKQKAEVLILSFSNGTPNLDFLDTTLSIIESHSGIKAQCLYQSFDSFASYCGYQIFKREMDLFLKLLATTGLYQAESRIIEDLQKWSSEQRQSFSSFLEKAYGVRPNTNSLQDIMKAVDIIGKNNLAKGSSHYLVNAAREFILTNYANTALSLDMVADVLGVSGGYLSRIFKSKAGQNFSEYLQNVRMENAKRMLKTTSITVNEIAIACGYNNATYFRMLFKSIFGITPRQYRQNQI